LNINLLGRVKLPYAVNFSYYMKHSNMDVVKLDRDENSIGNSTQLAPSLKMVFYGCVGPV
jgi:hypothetical protein